MWILLLICDNIQMQVMGNLRRSEVSGQRFSTETRPVQSVEQNLFKSNKIIANQLYHLWSVIIISICVCIQSPRQLYSRLSSQYRDYVEWCMGQGLELHSKAILSFEDYAARVIQSWWKHLATLRHTDNTAESAVMVAREELTDERAATVIQRAWRKHNVRRRLLKILHPNYNLTAGYQGFPILSRLD